MKPFATIELDCRTQQCPVPVLRLARAAGEIGHGGLVMIRADDPAFPKDLRAWARSAGSRIMRFDDHDGYYEAEIRIGDERDDEDDFEIDDSLLSRPDESPTIEPDAASQTFDLRGHPPGSLLDIVVKACGRAEPGAVLAIIVDDPSFVRRLDQWTATADTTLIAFQRRGPITEARIRVEPGIQPNSCSPVLAQPAAVVEPELERCTLLVLHNDHEALLAALLIANGAAAQGMDTSVFFTFWGLNLLRGPTPNLAEPEPKIGFMQRLMKWMMPKGPERQPLGKMHFAGLGKSMLSSIMTSQQIMSLPELMDSAEQLGVRFTACTMSMSVMGIAPRDLHPYPNLDYGGVASFVEDARRSKINMVF
jgi:peroxiredoxin family protein/TusA-related sulfurtransferase